jgi:lipid-A-disaccharide synthase
VPIYEKAGVPVTCVGHPLVDAVKKNLSTKQAKIKMGFKLNRRVVGVFPGSRKSEVEALLPIMLESAHRIQSKQNNVDIVLPVASGLDTTFIEEIIANSPVSVNLVEGDFYQLTAACDAVVAASGTVTLEIALLGVPHFITYRVAPLTYHVFRRLVKIPYFGLCNIVTNDNVVLELLQNDVTPERLEKEIIALFSDESKQMAEKIRLQVLTDLGPKGGAQNTAQLMTQKN